MVHWLKIMKQGGLLCIVHKAAVWPKWQAEQDKLVATKVWEKVWINEEPVTLFQFYLSSYLLLMLISPIKLNSQLISSLTF